NQIRRAELADNNNAMEGTWESDSTACGGSSDSEKIQGRIDTIKDQAKYLKIHDARILKRIEVFFVKLGKGDEIKSLITDYSKSTVGLDWNDPIPLDERYRNDDRYSDIVAAFDDFKEIAQYIVEAIQLENSWMRKMSTSVFIINIEKLRRTDIIILYVKICLK
ncbi:2681_t:CDS:2, partial [Ambispora leptoticha]